MVVDDILFSDHKYLFTSILVDKNLNTNYDEIKRLSSTKPCKMMASGMMLDVIKTFEELINNTQTCINQHRQTIKSTTRKRNTWVTRELINMIQERNKFYKKEKVHR